MKENNLIQLENDRQFVVLDKIYLENEEYLFVSELRTLDKKNKVKFLLSKELEGNYFVAEIYDKDVIAKLIKIVRNLK